MKKLLFVLPVLMLGNASAAAPIIVRDSEITTVINSCARIDATTVKCDLTITSNGYDNFYQAFTYFYQAISPTGKEINVSSISLSGEDITGNRVTLHRDITYPLTLVFSNYSENSIKDLIMGGQMKHTGSIAIKGAPQTTDALPGQAQLRQRTKYNGGDFIAAVAGCYPVGKNASCMVALLHDGMKGQVSKNTILYDGSIVQVNGLKLNANGSVNVTVGDATFINVPVK